MSLFIISDTHWSHKNILKHTNRPFSSVEEMDETMVENWNKVVRPEDTVYHLGDVFWNKAKAQTIAPRLNGRKIVVLGNHDWGAGYMESLGFQALTRTRKETASLYLPDIRILMAHRPRDLPTWNEHMRGVIVLCGHEHDNMPRFIKWVRDGGDKARPVMALNMSVEHHNYTPTPIEQVIDMYRSEISRYL